MGELRVPPELQRPTLTQRLAAFAKDTHIGSLPPVIDRAVRRALLDYAGVALAGAGHTASRAVAAMVAPPGSAGCSRVVGAAGWTDPASAALANGVAAHVLDWDDTLLPARIHLSASLFPPLLAAGELHGWRFKEMAAAFAIGFEIQGRLSRALYPSIHHRRWHSTAVVASTGAAAAIGRMLGSDMGQIAHGMGLAANGAGGLMSSFGTMAKAINVGRAGALGLQSAWLAKSGVEAHPDTIGAGGFLERYDDAPKRDLLLDGLGKDWAVLENGHKLYPCGFVAHPAIDAMRQLRKAADGRPALTGIQLRVSREAMELMGKAQPQNELDAKFSLLYNAAVAWVEGDVTPAAFHDDATVQNPTYRQTMALIEITPSAAIAQDEAFADTLFADGSRISTHVARARGTTANPLSDDDLIEKFQAARRLAGLDPGHGVAATIMQAEDFTANALMDLLSPARC